jgi:S-adenosylmethionine:tRNA ribosyltransferase-isomerase
MKRTDFSYELPPELIAQEPRERGRSRMMVVTPSSITHDSFANFPNYLEPGDVVVLNDTRVIPARLFARPKPGMQRPIEVLLVRVIPSVSEGAGSAGGAMSAPRAAGPPRSLANARDVRTWEAWCKPAKRVKAGDDLIFSDRLKARVLDKHEATITLQFEGDEEEIDRIGVMPLPPYIARPAPRDSDRESYQTVYAAERGAIAAPTAGLHFTKEILDEIAKRHEIVRVTLHVGIGTFEPVKVDDISQHVMHSERYEISEEAAAKLNAAKSIVAVGTTTLRALESAIRAGRFEAGRAETNIFITPGYRFRAVHKLLTNFHLPESTLLMLVSAFAGVETIRAAYAEAIAKRYFFFSYGDCMLLTREVVSG